MYLTTNILNYISAVCRLIKECRVGRYIDLYGQQVTGPTLHMQAVTAITLLIRPSPTADGAAAATAPIKSDDDDDVKRKDDDIIVHENVAGVESAEFSVELDTSAATAVPILIDGTYFSEAVSVPQDQNIYGTRYWNLPTFILRTQLIACANTLIHRSR
jgi:hypothetical protein